MTNIPELPFGLTPEDDVLYVAPYSPEDIMEAAAKAESEAALAALYKSAARLQSDMARLTTQVEGVINALPLKAAEIFDDLIMIAGNTQDLEKAQEILGSDFECNLGQARDIFDMLAGQGVVLTDPEEPPVEIESHSPPLSGPPPGVTIH